ncbi:hypothetical protein EXS71_00590 [Candidatus Uhrbacteria bacterium]|nr:hypothetical protein [Candidatus Uhrbacteria bacterium]
MSDEYQIGSGLSEQDLKLASWWTRHETQVRKFGYGCLIATSVLLWGYSLWSLLDAYAISYPRESRVTQAIAANSLAADTFTSSAPQPLQWSETKTFSTTGGRQDFIAQINNTNALWWADFTYRFNLNGQKTPDRKGFILPNHPRALTEIGWKSPGGGSAQLEVGDVRWHRVNPSHVERDYTTFETKRLQLKFENVGYKQDLKIDDQTVSQSSFLLHNLSAYGFWSVDMTVILYRLENPIAITTINAREVKPGESRPITINWFDNLPGISKTDIQTNINILDPNAYLPSNRF